MLFSADPDYPKWTYLLLFRLLYYIALFVVGTVNVWLKFCAPVINIFYIIIHIVGHLSIVYLHPPHCSHFLNDRKYCTDWKKWVPRKISVRSTPISAKIQNGGLALDMVRPTFFLWEIIQKLFFLSLSFHILVTRNNNSCHPGGSQWVSRGLFACFKAKNGFFKSIFRKSPCFLAF